MPSFNAVHPRNIRDAYYKPIGQLVVRWAFTELYLQSIVWHFWGIKDVKVGRALTWALSAQSKVALFETLSQRWVADTAVQSEISKIAKEAERLRCERNKYAHSVWGHRPGAKNDLRIFHMKELKHRITPRSYPANLAAIRSLASDIDALNVQLVALHRKVGAPDP